jgi:hypothetical protein
VRAASKAFVPVPVRLCLCWHLQYCTCGTTYRTCTLLFDPEPRYPTKAPVYVLGRYCIVLVWPGEVVRLVGEYEGESCLCFFDECLLSSLWLTLVERRDGG